MLFEPSTIKAIKRATSPYYYGFSPVSTDTMAKTSKEYTRTYFKRFGRRAPTVGGSMIWGKSRRIINKNYKGSPIYQDEDF